MPGDQAFTFIGDAPFSNTGTPELRVQGGKVVLDLDGNGSANVLFQVYGDIDLTAADFIL